GARRCPVGPAAAQARPRPVRARLSLYPHRVTKFRGCPLCSPINAALPRPRSLGTGRTRCRFLPLCGGSRGSAPPFQPGGRFQGPPSALPAAPSNRSAQRAAARHLKGAALPPHDHPRPPRPPRPAALGPRGAALPPPPCPQQEAARPPLAEGAWPRDPPPPPVSDWRSRPSIIWGRCPARPRSAGAAGGRARQRAAAAAGPWGSGAGRSSDSTRCAAKRSGHSGSGGRAHTQLGAEHVRQGERLGRALGRAGAGEIRWEKNITLGEPPGFLHSWWCVFWDLYCAAPERRDTCEHSSEAKAFHDYSAAAAPSPVLGNIPPNDGMPGGPIPPGFFQGPPGSQPSPHAQPPPHNPNSMMGPHSQPFMSPRYAGGPRPPIRMGNQPPGAVPGTQPLLPNSMDPTRQQGHPNMGGPMQRMNPPRGMGPMGPGPQNYGSGMRPPPNSLGPGMPGINMGPGAGRPWPNPSSANSIPYSSSSPGTYVVSSPSSMQVRVKVGHVGLALGLGGHQQMRGSRDITQHSPCFSAAGVKPGLHSGVLQDSSAAHSAPSLCRVLQEVEGHQEHPSCLAQQIQQIQVTTSTQ
uniref:Single stranded DNA binding protein 3 n=1 Tax=Coturnix japonica TaxID=93934 RepID=A0A8C2YBM3_COTJA